MSFGRRVRWGGVLIVGLLGVSQVAVASDTEIEAHIRRLQDGLQPPVRIQGETPTLTPLAKRMAELNVPGLSVALIHNGKVEWARGFGVKKIGGAPVTPDTLFQAASISKPVFALGVLRLVDQGKLDLDTDINRYLKSWKLPENEFTRTTKVTLREILSHSAGITVHGFPGYASDEALPSVVQILDGAKPANTEAIRVDATPGTLYRYSGGGYVIAQQLLADVTGVPTPTYMHEAVLAPLGMSHSTYEQPLPTKRKSEVALAYNSAGKPVNGGFHIYPELAAAGLWTTPTDLARYAIGVQQMLTDKSKQVISASLARKMLTPVRGQHGLGPMVGGPPEHRFFTHSGGNEGYRCILIAYENGDGIVVMTNADNGSMLMDEVVRTVALDYQWKEFAPPERSITQLNPEQLDRLVGAYQAPDRRLLIVQREGDRLVGGYRGDLLELIPQSDHELFAKQNDLLLEFRLDDVGKATSATWTQQGTATVFHRSDDERSRAALDEAAQAARRFSEQKPFPGGEEAARGLITGISTGRPDYDHMSPGFADLTREELSLLRAMLQSFGALKSLAFHGVGPNGDDRYKVVFENTTQVLSLRMLPDGRIDSANIEPG